MFDFRNIYPTQNFPYINSIFYQAGFTRPHQQIAGIYNQSIISITIICQAGFDI